jgi:hypothetical protein
MKVAYRKSTKEIINDFQPSVTEETLIKNAISAGIPENDIEIKDVSKKEYEKEHKKILDAGEAQAELERMARAEAHASLVEKLKSVVGLTNAEIALILPQ